MTLSDLFRLAAVVLFVIGALLAWNVFGNASIADLLGLALAGLACLTAAGTKLPKGP